MFNVVIGNCATRTLFVTFDKAEMTLEALALSLLMMPIDIRLKSPDAPVLKVGAITPVKLKGLMVFNAAANWLLKSSSFSMSAV